MTGHGSADVRAVAAAHDLGVIHGRFQVLHNDHLKYLMAGYDRCAHLVVGVTNPDPSLSREEDVDQARSLPESNPLTYYERQLMIRRAMSGAGADPGRLTVVPFPVSCPELYGVYVPLSAVFLMTIYDDWGRRKLEYFKSQGLAVEVLWKRPIQEKGVSGTEVRRRMASGGEWESMVPPETARLCREWNIPARLRGLGLCGPGTLS